MPPIHPISSTRHFTSRVASSTRSITQHIVHVRFPQHFFSTPVGDFMFWLSTHTHAAYSALFFGSYFETLIGTGFFIPGEVIFLAGSILAGAHALNIWLVIVVVYAGAILGDSSSYFIGKLLGESVFKEERMLLNRKNYRKAEVFLETYGPKAIFLARLVGPFSKIAPALAGVFEIPFPTFLLYNIPGVIIGVGQFLAVGYFFGDRYALVLLILERYVALLFVVLVVALIAYWYVNKRKKHHARHAHAVHHAEEK